MSNGNGPYRAVFHVRNGLLEVGHRVDLADFLNRKLALFVEVDQLGDKLQAVSWLRLGEKGMATTSGGWESPSATLIHVFLPAKKAPAFTVILSPLGGAPTDAAVPL